jgi:tetratricopeptide (TPR) repeat protein
LLYQDQGKLAESETALTEAATMDARYESGLLKLAQAYEDKKDPAGALRLYEKASKDLAAQERAANLRLQLGKTSEAIESLLKVIAQSPTPANRYALGVAYLRNKELAKAELQFAEALKLEPDNLELRLTYARVLRDQRKFEPALVEFRRAAVNNVDRAETWSEIGGLLVLQDRCNEALPALDNLVRLKAELPGHVFLRAICLDRMKQPKLALPVYQKFLELSLGKNPDEEFKARNRIKTLEKEIAK